MEALTVCDGVQLAIDRNLASAEIETDAKVVLNHLEDPGGSRSDITSIYHEIKELSGFISSINFKFIGRLANEAAHLYAKNVVVVIGEGVCRLIISHLVSEDCNTIT
jgi:hypothetical protein